MTDSDMKWALKGLVNVGIAYGHDKATDKDIEDQCHRVQDLLTISNAKAAKTAMEELKKHIGDLNMERNGNADVEQRIQGQELERRYFSIVLSEAIAAQDAIITREGSK